MRHLVAVALAPLAMLACGSAPGEEHVGATSESVTFIGSSCEPGYRYQCNRFGGLELCGCTALSCDWVIPPPPTPYPSFIEAWAVQTIDGICPEIVTPTGTWAEINGLPPPPKSKVVPFFDGVPVESGACYGPDSTVNPSQKCSDKFGGASCCTYVWWPKGYPDPTVTWPVQDTQALCDVAGRTLVALKQPTEIDRCPQPGGGGCGTCARP